MQPSSPRWDSNTVRDTASNATLTHELRGRSGVTLRSGIGAASCTTASIAIATGLSCTGNGDGGKNVATTACTPCTVAQYSTSPQHGVAGTAP